VTCTRKLVDLAALALGLVLALASAPASAQIYVYEDANGVVHFSDVRHHDGFQRHAPATQRSTLRRETTQVENRFDTLIRRASRTHRISPGLVKAVIHAESRFDPHAVSNRGARGLMQLMPATAGELGVRDAFNPWQNIEAGTRYLQQLVDRFDGDLQLGLAAYHAGPAKVVKYGGVPPYRTTRQYVDRVLKLYRRYHADFR